MRLPVRGRLEPLRSRKSSRHGRIVATLRDDVDLPSGLVVPSDPDPGAGVGPDESFAIAALEPGGRVTAFEPERDAGGVALALAQRNGAGRWWHRVMR